MQIMMVQQADSKVTLFATDPTQIVELKLEGDAPDLQHSVSCGKTLLNFLLGIQVQGAHGDQSVGFIRPDDLIEVKESNPYHFKSKDASTRLAV